MRRTPQVIAASGSLAAFSIALISGAAANNAPTHVLTTGLLAMFGGYLVFYALSLVGSRAVDEHVAQFIKSNPVPPIEGMNGGESVHHAGSGVESS